MQVEFDDEIIAYETIVEEFWKCHDPTTLDRQGPDVGRQYRSVIYYLDDLQKISKQYKHINLWQKEGLQLEKSLKENRSGTSLWQVLILIALVLLITESLLLKNWKNKLKLN